MQSDREMVIQKFLVEYVEPDGKDVLEVGCGDGRITAELAGWAASYVGLDTDQAKLDEAEARVPGVAFTLGDGQELDFSDESFDVVLFTLCLHELDAAAALDEACRVLRPGGRVVVLEPVPFSEIGRVRTLFREDEEAHEQAQRAVAEGELPVLRRDLFRTTLVFDDTDELLDYAFVNFGDDEDEDDRDEDLAHLALGELGDKRNDEPLTLYDDLLIVQLGRNE